MSELSPLTARRALPSNFDAERAVIILAMQTQGWASELAFNGFRPDWLHLPAHRLLWSEIANVRELQPDHGEIDLLSLQSRMVAVGTLDAIGGPGYLLELASTILAGAPTPETAEYYARLLRQAWQRRQAIEAGTKLVQAAYEPSEGFDRDMELAVKAIRDLSAPAAASKLVNGLDVLKVLSEELDAAFTTKDDALVKGEFISAGFPELDEKVGGLIPDFWLIGADTSAGKTVLAMQLVRAVLRAGQRALVFPLEMTAMKLVRRIVSAEGEVPMSRLIQPRKLLHEDMAKIGGMGSSWNAKNLTIYNDSDLHIQDVRAIARAEHAKEPLGCVLLDYIQLATAGRFRDQANREQEISFIGAECKRMSNELGIPVIAPTQLNDDGKVRESRALKHHAAVYLVIEEGDESKRPPLQPRILCAKNRDGERDWSMPYKLIGDIQAFVK